MNTTTLTTKKSIFDAEFKNYFESKREKHCINDLLNFSLKNEYIDESMLGSSMKEFKNSIAKYILRNENNSGVSTIEQNRKNSAKDIVYFVENYLLTLEPNEALSQLLNGDKDELITKSIEYYNNYKNNILNKLHSIKSITDLEYKNNERYSEQLDFLEFALDRKSDFEGLTYGPMIEFGSETLTSESYLCIYEEFVDYFLEEANIIDKFDLKARYHILKIIDKNSRDIETTQILTNICHAILTNYVLLSIYSNNPEKLVVTSDNYNIIKNELYNGSLDEEEIVEYICNGPIKFNIDEIEYIKNSFMKTIVDKDKKAYKSLFVHIAI